MLIEWRAGAGLIRKFRLNFCHRNHSFTKLVNLCFGTTWILSEVSGLGKRGKVGHIMSKFGGVWIVVGYSIPNPTYYSATLLRLNTTNWTPAENTLEYVKHILSRASSQIHFQQVWLAFAVYNNYCIIT